MIDYEYIDSIFYLYCQYEVNRDRYKCKKKCFE